MTVQAVDSSSGPTGRRERAKQARRERIATAARELLEADGFEAMTIQRLADRADVAVGTVFRYASNKAELVLLALSPDIDAALDAGLAAAETIADPVEAVAAVLAPVVEWGIRLGPTTLVFQREVLFGASSERNRPESIASSLRVESELVTVLAERGIPDAPARARLLFDASQMELSRALQTGGDDAALLDLIRAQARLVLHPNPAAGNPAG